jgi:hypothetical protein
LRSLGPLIEVSTEALGDLPQEATASQQQFGALRLAGYVVQEPSAIDPASTAVTLFWEAAEQTEDPLRIYVRWAGDSFVTRPDAITGQHPAANYYPVAAWRDDEIVPDFHLLSRPIAEGEQTLDLQVAVGPPFTPAADLAWQTITQVTQPPTGEISLETPQHAQIGHVLLSGVEFPPEIRPQTALPVIVSGYGQDAAALQFNLEPLDRQIREQDKPALTAGSSLPAFVHAVEVDTDLPNGSYRLVSSDPQAAAVCGWLARPSAGCVLGEVQISGIPLPQGATNYEDKIALLDVDLPVQQLQPSGELPVTLRWQSLSPMDEDYTLFLQVLTAKTGLSAR